MRKRCDCPGYCDCPIFPRVWRTRPLPVRSYWRGDGYWTVRCVWRDEE